MEVYGKTVTGLGPYGKCFSCPSILSNFATILLNKRAPIALLHCVLDVV